MGFYIDLGATHIEAFRIRLAGMSLIPSWKILKENIDDRFDRIQEQGISNLEELCLALKSKGKIDQFSKATGIPNKYLTVLNRVIKGYKQQPIKLNEFYTMQGDTTQRLEKVGIKNARHLYDNALSASDRQKLSLETGVEQSELLALTKLADLTRIRWVNHTFAYVLTLAGYDTAQRVAEADDMEMYEHVKRANEEHKIYNAHIGQNDMKMCIESARLLDFEIEC
ncbi:MAG: DUF4332 domain-containing protein [Bacteroidota bacterium]